jgi:hypothetical protein
MVYPHVPHAAYRLSVRLSPAALFACLDAMIAYVLLDQRDLLNSAPVGSDNVVADGPS